MSVFTEAFRRGEAYTENPGAYALWDRHPLSVGHTLVVPRMEVVRLDDLDMPDLDWLWTLVVEVKAKLRGHPLGPKPTGIRLVVNEGPASEGGPQHIAHLHVHVIPWYAHMKP